MGLSRRTVRLRTLIIVAAALLGPAGARAQRVVGVVLLADSTTPASSIVVTASDTAGHVVANALASERGEFQLTMRVPGAFVVRALRIGFRPTPLPPLHLAAGETREVRIILDGAPIALERVTVRGERVCRISEDSGRVVARVWEEARKAMLASRLAAQDTRLQTRWFIYDRTLDSAARRVRSQTVTIRSGSTARPFFAESPESLDRFGYVTRVGTDVLFRAPDESVLLSELFASTHCFQLEPPPKGGADWVGVAFRPSRERDGINEIAGTFWLDRRTAELRVLELHYTGLPRAYEDAGVGARVEFERLAGGQWFVSRWYIRMAQMAVQPSASVPGLRAPNVLRGGGIAPDGGLLAPRAILLSGGEVAEIRRGDASLFDGGGATYVALLQRADTETVLAGTRVDFDSTGYSAAADSAGEARLAHVLPGRYRTSMTTAMMREAVLPPLTREVEVTEHARIDTMTVPSVAALVARACFGGRTPRAGDPPRAMLYGTVVDAGGRVLAGVTVTVTHAGRVTAAAGGALMAQTTVLDIPTDAEGRWRYCGAPRDAPVDVRAHSGDHMSPHVTVRVPAGAVAQRVALVLSSAPPTEPFF